VTEPCRRKMLAKSVDIHRFLLIFCFPLPDTRDKVKFSFHLSRSWCRKSLHHCIYAPYDMWAAPTMPGTCHNWLTDFHEQCINVNFGSVRSVSDQTVVATLKFIKAKLG
jgi:hypothetical protein